MEWLLVSGWVPFPSLSAAFAAPGFGGGLGTVGGIGFGRARGACGFLPSVEFAGEFFSLAGVDGNKIARFPGIIREMIEFGGF